MKDLTKELEKVIFDYITTQCMVHDIMLVHKNDLPNTVNSALIERHEKRKERLSKLLASAIQEQVIDKIGVSKDKLFNLLKQNKEIECIDECYLKRLADTLSQSQVLEVR
jgi:hypothetical protein